MYHMINTIFNIILRILPLCLVLYCKIILHFTSSLILYMYTTYFIKCVVYVYICLYEYTFVCQCSNNTQIASFMGPTWGPLGSCRPQIGPKLAPCTLLSEQFILKDAMRHHPFSSLFSASVFYMKAEQVLTKERRRKPFKWNKQGKPSLFEWDLAQW